MTGLFLVGTLAAMLLYFGTTALGNGAAGQFRPEAGKGAHLSTSEVMLGGVLWLGPVTAQLLLWD